MINFRFKMVEAGGHLTLTETAKKLFKTSELKLSISEWDKLSDIGQVESLGKIRMAEQEAEGKCRELDDGSGYFLSAQFIASLSDYHAGSLGLPKTFPYQINIQTISNIGSPSFKIAWTAYDRGRPLTIRLNTCFVTISDKHYRLPKTLYDVVTCIDAFNHVSEPSFDEKNKFIAELKSLLPESANNTLNFEGELAKISLQHASAMSLEIKGDENSLSFNPVLFHKKIMDKANEQQETIDESEQILTKNDARAFAASFTNAEDVKSTYLLGSGKYVFIDEALRPALTVVKQASKFSREQRIDFAKAPQKYIKSMLEVQLSTLPDIDREVQSLQIDELFIETNQFSERVTEMGIWETPDLPWLQTEPNEWRSDNYSFYVQGKLISFPNGDLDHVATDLKKALDEGKSAIVIGEETIVPDPQFLRTLEELMTKKPDAPDQPSDNASPDDVPDDEPESPSGPIVPLTKENFEVVEYNRNFIPRDDDLNPAPPACLNSAITLKSHQQIGVNWLVEAYNRGFPGVLMADDMGLGKTLQALSFLAIMVETGKTENGTPLLIVAPVGLLKNWEEEHEKHLTYPGLGTMAKLYGNSLKQFKTSKGRDIETGTAVLDVEQFKNYDWLLTTYETLRDYQASFAQIKLSCVVFDELQKAKNPRSLISKGTKVLNADFSIGLTGTPVENTLADLWTIMDILSPGRLGDLKGFLEEYPEPAVEDPEPGILKLQALSKQLLESSLNGPAPILRRMKTDLKDADLPEKILVPSSKTTLPMPQIQEDAYRGVSNKLNSNAIKMIDALHQFRVISRNPISPEQAGQLSVDEFINASARLTATFNILDEIYEKQEKVLLFVESRALQPQLASMIKQKYKMNFQPLTINGLISGDARQKRVNKFQKGGDGFDAIIISPKAGGVGLTLTAANNVIHVERWWNPAVEDQCTDRAYRIGQTKAVNVYTPISRSGSIGDKSFDCILDKLLQKKRSLASGVFMPTQIDTNDFSGAFTQDTSRKVLTLDEIDCLEKGSDFENVVIDIIRLVGLSASKTQKSHDYGADIIVCNKSSGRSAIVQCKHRADIDKNINETAAHEAVNATKHYQLNSPKLVVTTNAISATTKCSHLCIDEGILLVLRDDLLGIGNLLLKELS